MRAYIGQLPIPGFRVADSSLARSFGVPLTRLKSAWLIPGIAGRCAALECKVSFTMRSSGVVLVPLHAFYTHALCRVEVLPVSGNTQPPPAQQATRGPGRHDRSSAPLCDTSVFVRHDHTTPVSGWTRTCHLNLKSVFPYRSGTRRARIQFPVRGTNT